MDGRLPAITSLEKNGILETAEHKLIWFAGNCILIGYV